MYSFIAFWYEFVSEFVPFLIVLIGMRYVRGKYATPNTKSNYILPIIFALYIMAVFYVTDVGTIYDAMTAELDEMKERINWIPFSKSIDIVGYMLNIVMFVPFGFLVPLIWRKMGKTIYITIAGFGLSASIEISQLFSYRGTDVDDLIVNTLGAVLGFFLYKVWNKATKSKFQLVDIDNVELLIYVLTLFLGRFLLFNRVGLIDLVYGY